MSDTCSDPQASTWGGIEWSGWHDFAPAVSGRLIPATTGLYRFRDAASEGLLYIGESGARRGRRSRLGALYRGMNRHSAEYYLNWEGLARRPHRGHYAAPYLRQCQDAGCKIEVSWSLPEFPDKAERRQKEHELIVAHRRVVGADPPVQHGGEGTAAFVERLSRSRAAESGPRCA